MSADLSTTAYDPLWMHFTRMSSHENAPVPTIVRGGGIYIYDADGGRYLDGLSGLFVVQAGHGRRELAEAAAKQDAELAFFPVGPTRTPSPSNWPSGSPTRRRATWARSSSPPGAARPSRPRGSWPSGFTG